MHSYYDILGVQPNCKVSDLRKSYHSLARKYHPDKNENGLEEFKKIDLAYRILIDPEKRRLYDQGVLPKDDLGNRDFTWNDLFEILKYEIPTEKAEPLSQTLEITLDEAYNGAVKTVDVTVTVPCSYHYGIVNNQSILLIGEGNFDDKSLPGDLIFVVKILNHDVFSIVGSGDLERTVFISSKEARNGFHKSLETLDMSSGYDRRRIFITYKKGPIYDGFRMKVEGEGMPDFFDNYKKGDLYLTFHIDDSLIDDTTENGHYGDQVILIRVDELPTKTNLILCMPKHLFIAALAIVIILAIVLVLLIEFV